ncbi:hypothetical protein PROFUN_04251 [Planoprotostelium fungivorum]|uniref:C2H2-type domain-containing protein n=1 Tax=Planoprotostelium fungivorum TaxID=1890364 RepID=A0A2P6NUX9_9EUKA|nr:hypothetical protein PROFUN_04251 [Planoprotostelium fungivorum]
MSTAVSSDTVPLSHLTERQRLRGSNCRLGHIRSATIQRMQPRPSSQSKKPSKDDLVDPPRASRAFYTGGVPMGYAYPPPHPKDRGYPSYAGAYAYPYPPPSAGPPSADGVQYYFSYGYPPPYGLEAYPHHPPSAVHPGYRAVHPSEREVSVRFCEKISTFSSTEKHVKREKRRNGQPRAEPPPAKKSKRNEQNYLLRSESFTGTFNPSRTPFEGVFEGAPELGFVVDLTIQGQSYRGFILNTMEQNESRKDHKAPNFPHMFTGADVENMDEVVESGRKLILEASKPPPYYVSMPYPPPNGSSAAPPSYAPPAPPHSVPMYHLPPLPPNASPSSSYPPLDTRKRSNSGNKRELGEVRISPMGSRHPEALTTPAKKPAFAAPPDAMTGKWSCYFEGCKMSFDSSEGLTSHIEREHPMS